MYMCIRMSTVGCDGSVPRRQASRGRTEGLGVLARTPAQLQTKGHRHRYAPLTRSISVVGT